MRRKCVVHLFHLYHNLYSQFIVSLARRLENNRQIIRDLQYESETVAMSYQTSGVWANNEAGLIFKTADRKGTMLMVGGDTGVLRLYQYPCDVESIDYYKRVNGVSKMF